MKLIERIQIFLIILLPIGLTALVPLSPLPVELKQANVAAREAFVEGESTAEQTSLESILTFEPWRGDLWQRLGRLTLDDGDYQKAVEAFTSATENGTLDAQGKLWLADALILCGETSEAKTLLRDQNQNEDAFLLLQNAELQRRINDAYGALATLLKAYSIDPLNPEINYQLGIQLAAQQPDSAIKFLELPAQGDPVKFAIAQALIDLIHGTTENEGSSLRYVYIGQTLARFEEWDVAVRAFRTAVELDPKNADAWALLGEALQQTGEDGFSALEEALSLDPHGEMANGLTALFFQRQQKTEAALAYLQRARAANPGAAVWEIETGNTLAGSGDLQGALTHFQAGVNLDTRNWVAWRALAVFSFTHNFEVSTTGMEAARQALLNNPNSPALMDLMGTGLMMMGDLDSAERFFLQANALDANQAAILIHLGQLYINKGEKERGFTYLRQAVEVARDGRLREMAHRLIKENGGT